MWGGFVNTDHLFPVVTHPGKVLSHIKSKAMSHLILLLALYQSSTTLGWLLPPSVPHTFLNKLSAIPRGDSIPTSDYTVEEQTALLDDMEEVSMEELEGPKVDSSQYMLGDTDGLEDPIDAPWRIKAESLINSAASEQSITIQDITWKFCVLTITTQGGLDADQIQALHLRINELLEEQVSERASLVGNLFIQVNSIQY